MFPFYFYGAFSVAAHESGEVVGADWYSGGFGVVLCGGGVVALFGVLVEGKAFLFGYLIHGMRFVGSQMFLPLCVCWDKGKGVNKANASFTHAFFTRFERFI